MNSNNSYDLKHIIYCSKPTILDDKTISDILTTSRRNNTRSGVTGALVCRSDLYFQYLEGPVEAVDKTFEKIKSDTRHSQIQVLKNDTTNRKLFASWAMREDPVKTWMWTRKEVENGLLSKIKPTEAFKAFEQLSREVDQFDQLE